MKKKQKKFEKYLNSVVTSHDDMEEDRKEIEKNVKKMLELFENNHADVAERSDLVFLVNDIKKRFHSLYGRHDGLIGKIKNNVRQRKGDSASGTSDSGSEDSSDEDGTNNTHELKIAQQISLEDYQSVQEQLDSSSKRNADLEAQTTSMQAKLEESQHLTDDLVERELLITKLEGELQTMKDNLKPVKAENESLKTEIEKLKEQEGKLGLLLRDLQDEKGVLRLEKENISSQLLEAHNSVAELKIELEKRIEEGGKVRDENSCLRVELGKTAQEAAHLNQQIVVTSEERESLQTVAAEHKLANDNLISENAKLLSENLNMMAQQEAATQQVANLNDQLLMIEGENDALKSEILSLSTHMHEADKTIKDITIGSGLLKEDISKLNDKINDLNHQLKVKDDEKNVIELESSEASKLAKQAEERIVMLSAEIERMKTEYSLLLTGHENLIQGLEVTNQELSKLKQALETTESEMKSLIAENSVLLTGQENLKLDMESNNQELLKIKQALSATESERNSLIEEKSALLSKIDEGRMIIDALKAHIEEVGGEKSQLQQKISNLDLEFQAANAQLTDVKNALVASEEEKMALVSQNSVVESNLLEAELRSEGLLTELGKLNEKNSIIQSKIEEVEKAMNDLHFERDGLVAVNAQLGIKVKELIKEMETANARLNHLEKFKIANEEEKTNFKSEISMLSGKLHQAESDNEKLDREIDLLREENTVLQQNQTGLGNKMVEHEKRLEHALSEMQHLKDTLELAQKEVTHEVQSLVDTFKADLLEMAVEKNRLDHELKKLAEITSEKEVSLKKMESGLRSKILNQEALLKKYEELLTKHNQLEDSYLESCAKLETAEKRLEEMEMKEQIIQRLNGLCSEQKKEIGKLDECNQELSKLKQALEKAESEIKSLIAENLVLVSGQENLKLGMESNNQELLKIKQALAATESESNSLIEEKSALLSKIDEGQMVIDGLKTHIEEVGGEKSQLQLKISNLNLEFQAANAQLTDVKYALVASEEEKKALVSQNSVAESNLLEAELRSEGLLTELRYLNEKNSMLQSKIEEVEKATNDLNFERDELEAVNALLGIKVKELIKEMETENGRLNHLEKLKIATEEEKTNFKSEISMLSGKLHQAESDNEKLDREMDLLREENTALQQNQTGMGNKMVEHEKRLEHALREMQHLKDTLELAQKEVSHDVQSLVDTFKADLLEMAVERGRLDHELKKLAEITLENEVLLKKMKSGLRSKILDKEALLKKYEELLTKHNQLEDSYLESCANLENAEKRLEEMEMKEQIIQRLDGLCSEQKKEIGKLDECNQELSKLKQALKITESEMKSLIAENSVLLTIQENLKLDLESNNQELLKIKQALEATESERNSLIEEKSALLSKIDEGQMAIDGLKTHIEEVGGEKTQLQLKISNLDLEFQAANAQLTDVKNALMSSEEEKNVLVSQNSAVESNLLEAELRSEGLLTELGYLNDKNSILQSKIEEVEKATNDLNFERDGLVAVNTQLGIKVRELIKEMETENGRLNHLEKLKIAAEEEKTNFKSEILMLSGKLHQAESDNEKLDREIDLLREENTALQQNQTGLGNKMLENEKRLEHALSEMQHLKDTLELAQKEVSHEVQSLVDTFKADLLEMAVEKGCLDHELKKLAEITSENEVSLKKMESGLRSKILDQEGLLKNYEELLTKHEQLEERYLESCAKLETAEKSLEEMEMKEQIIQRLDGLCSEQKKEIGKLDESYRELLEKLSFTEVGKIDADKEIQRFEVVLRLSNQKLKITEAEYKEKEERWKEIIKRLQDELKLLGIQVLMWSEKFNLLKNECRQLEVLVQAGMGTLADDLHEVESTSLENIEHVKKQVAECLAELQKMQALLELELHKKKKLEKENRELEVKLRYKEGIVSKLKDEASLKGAKLAEKEKELVILEMRFVESEKNLKEKEREILDRDEEKREAIRQLCLLIEYHWENCNHLVKYLSSVHQNRRTS